MGETGNTTKSCAVLLILVLACTVNTVNGQATQRPTPEAKTRQENSSAASHLQYGQVKPSGSPNLEETMAFIVSTLRSNIVHEHNVDKEINIDHDSIVTGEATVVDDCTINYVTFEKSRDRESDGRWSQPYVRREEKQIDMNYVVPPQSVLELSSDGEDSKSTKSVSVYIRLKRATKMTSSIDGFGLRISARSMVTFAFSDLDPAQSFQKAVQHAVQLCTAKKPF